MSDRKKRLKSHLLSIVERLENMTENELKTATAAALERGELWELIEPYFAMSSGPGVETSENTLRSYRGGVRKYVEWARSTGVELPRPRYNTGVLYVRDLQAQGLSPVTIRGRVAAAKHLHALLRYAGVSTAHPFADVNTPRDSTPAWAKRGPYSVAAVRRLVDAAQDLEDRAPVLLGAHAGLRASEMLDLTWVAADIEAGRLDVRDTKGGGSRVVPASTRLIDTLRGLREVAGGREHVLSFRSPSALRNRVKALCKAAGVRYLGVHSLRHTAGTRLYSEKKDLQEVAHFLGHDSLSSTHIYTRYAALEHPAVRDWD